MNIEDISEVRISLTKCMNLKMPYEFFEKYGAIGIVVSVKSNNDVMVTLSKNGHYAGTRVTDYQRYEVSRGMFTKRKLRFGYSPAEIYSSTKDKITLICYADQQVPSRHSNASLRGTIKGTPHKVVPKAPAPEPQEIKTSIVREHTRKNFVPAPKGVLESIRTKDLVRELNSRSAADESMTFEIRDDHLVVLVEYS